MQKNVKYCKSDSHIIPFILASTSTHTITKSSPTSYNFISFSPSDYACKLQLQFYNYDFRLVSIQIQTYKHNI